MIYEEKWDIDFVVLKKQVNLITYKLTYTKRNLKKIFMITYNKEENTYYSINLKKFKDGTESDAYLTFRNTTLSQMLDYLALN